MIYLIDGLAGLNKSVTEILYKVRWYRDNHVYDTFEPEYGIRKLFCDQVLALNARNNL